MSNLIKNEIFKILKKKSLYIMLIVTLGFVILTNVIYKFAYSGLMNLDYYNETYIKMLEDEQKTLDPDNIEEVEIYIGNKTEIDVYNLLKQYDKDSWQYEIILTQGRNYIYEINNCMYGTKNDENLAVAKEEYNKFIERLNSGDWREFAEEELEMAKQNILNDESKTTNVQIEAMQMRLDYNIEYGNNYKNDALSQYSSSKMQVLEYEQNNNRTYSEEVQYQEAKKQLEESRYVIENDKDILNIANTRGILINLFSEYQLFIIITVVLIAGVIVSEEFNKGTIKLLLVRPYSRTKILLAKFIVVLMVIIFIIIAIAIMQLIVGGIFFGFDSLKIPVVEYNYNTGELTEISLFQKVVMTSIGKLPIYILIGTLAFALSTIFTNTAVAITISLLGYMASNILNQFVYYYKVAWLKYFVTPNWDFTQFFYGKLPTVEGLSVPFSIAICIIYFAIMIIPTFIVFRKKNIKNI